MHRCVLWNELGQTLEIEDGLWIYNSHDEFLADFECEYCPKCGTHIQPERSKREDSIPEWEKRCGALNSMET